MKRRLIYQLLTDRFASSEGPLKGLTRTGSARAWRHRVGGDFEGLRRRLDYIGGLGAGAIWISPIVRNSKLSGAWSSDGYHGYWARDFGQLQPELGSEAELVHLLSDCRQRNLIPILDLVLNHSNPTDSQDGGDLYHRGELFCRYREDREGIFHHLGEFRPGRHRKKLYWEKYRLCGLADLNQDHPRVERLLIDSHLYWLRLGFGGVRLDTARHVSARWIGKWKKAIDAGCPGLFHFAEWSLGGADREESLLAQQQMGMHLTDFSLARLWRRWLRGEGDAGELRAYVELEARMEEPDLKVNFLDNHDQPRLINQLLTAGLSEGQSLARLEVGLAMLLFWRGVPCLYYGTELGLYTRRRPRGKAWGSDPYNREPMPFPKVETRLMELTRLMSDLRARTELTDCPLTLDCEGESLILRRGLAELKVARRGPDSSLQLRQRGRLLWNL